MDGKLSLFLLFVCVVHTLAQAPRAYCCTPMTGGNQFPRRGKEAQKETSPSSLSPSIHFSQRISPLALKPAGAHTPPSTAFHGPGGMRMGAAAMSKGPVATGRACVCG
jgi:hypothetical protein